MLFRESRDSRTLQGYQCKVHKTTGRNDVTTSIKRNVQVLYSLDGMLHSSDDAIVRLSAVTPCHDPTKGSVRLAGAKPRIGHLFDDLTHQGRLPLRSWIETILRSSSNPATTPSQTRFWTSDQRQKSAKCSSASSRISIEDGKYGSRSRLNPVESKLGGRVCLLCNTQLRLPAQRR